MRPATRSGMNTSYRADHTPTHLAGLARASPLHSRAHSHRQHPTATALTIAHLTRQKVGVVASSRRSPPLSSQPLPTVQLPPSTLPPTQPTDQSHTLPIHHRPPPIHSLVHPTIRHPPLQQPIHPSSPRPETGRWQRKTERVSREREKVPKIPQPASANWERSSSSFQLAKT